MAQKRPSSYMAGRAFEFWVRTSSAGRAYLAPPLPPMPDSTPPPVIRATHLRKSFGAQAVVRDVSFTVAAGETLVLLGPSGCGKTTLLRLLNRLVEPDGGTKSEDGSSLLDRLFH